MRTSDDANSLKIKGIEAAGEEAQNIVAYFIEDPERAIRKAISAGCYSAPRKYDILECRFLGVEERPCMTKEACYSVVKLIVTIEERLKKKRYRKQAGMTVFSNEIPTFVYWIRICKDY
jgi:hypothetical protein